MDGEYEDYTVEVTYKNNEIDMKRTKYNPDKNGTVGEKNSNHGNSA